MEIFDGGKKLFPPDPLAKIAQEIRESKQVPDHVIEGVLAHIARTDTGSGSVNVSAVTSEIRKSYAIINYRRLLFDEDIAPFLSDFEWRKKRLAETRVTVRPVRAELREDT